MAGLTPTGLVIKTFDQIRTEMNDAVKSTYGQSVDVSDSSVLGRLIAIFAEREASLWELSEAIHSSSDPNKASNDALDALAGLTGTIRKAATSSTVTLYLSGTASTVVTAGSQVSVNVTQEKFSTDADVTLVAATAWAPSTAYVIGDVVKNSGNIYYCTIAGTSAGSGGPAGPSTAIVDNTVTWAYVGPGDAWISVTASSVNTGPVVGATYDIVTIETPISGWDGVNNMADAIQGSNKESDEDLRVRRESDLSAPGTGPIDALRSDLLSLSGVTTVKLFVNNSDVTDSDGVPPHAVEALIQGGTAQEIYDQLLASVCAGIATHGTNSGTAIDSEGVSHTMKYSTPTPVNIWTDITLIYDATLYPADGDDQVIAAVIADSQKQLPGKDVVSSQIKAICFEIPGVLDVTFAKIGTSSSPAFETTITIASRDIAVQATARMSVSSSPGTP